MERRYDIDWIRVMVFDLLILYHVGMFFVPWDFHIKNDELLEWLRYPMLFLSQWRLPILFLVSGIVTRFALTRKSGPEYVKERIIRLAVPLAFGMLVVVPPQVYVERLLEGTVHTNFFAYYPSTFNGPYPEGNFSWHHLWFLPYLLLMSIASTPLLLRLKRENNRLVSHLRALTGKHPAVVFLVPIPVIPIEIFLRPLFPVTHAFVGDWYTMAFYYYFFLMGYLISCVGEPFWQAVQKYRVAALFTGLVTFPVLYALWFYTEQEFLMAVVRVFNLWVWIVVVLGWCARYLNRKSAVIRYRNEAVYPFYILHQTVIILLGYGFLKISLPPVVEMLLMMALTFVLTWIIYEGLRRIRWIRPLIGLR